MGRVPVASWIGMTTMPQMGTDVRTFRQDLVVAHTHHDVGYTSSS